MELEQLRLLALEIAQETRSWARDAGGSTEGLVGSALDRFEKSVREDVLIVDAGFLGEPTSEDAAALARLLGMTAGVAAQQSFLQSALLRLPGAGRSYGVRYRPILRSSVEPMGEPRGSVAILMRGGAIPEGAGAQARLSQFVRDRLILLHSLPVEDEPRLVRLAGSTPRVQRMDSEGPALGELLGPTAEVIARTAGWAGALVSILDAARLTLGRDQQHLRARRCDLIARIARLQAPGRSSSSGPDPLAELKSRLQRSFTELERRAAERASILFGASRGALIGDLDRQVESGLKMTRTARTAGIETAVSAEFESALNAGLRQEIQRLFTEEVEAMNRTSAGAALTLEKGLSEIAATPLSLAPFVASPDGSGRLLGAMPPIQSQHRGVLVTPGVAEFFSKVRKYIMLLIMSVSMFGLGQTFKKHREYYLPSSIVLLLFGAYSVYTATRQERLEREEEDFLEAAKGLRTECRKVLAESSRLWSASFSALASEQSGHYLAILETVGKELSQRRIAEASGERERLQRQLAGVETQEKRNLAAAKSRETLLVTLRPKLARLSPIVGLATAPGAAGTPVAVPEAPGASIAQATPANASAISDARARLEALRARRSQT